MKAILIALMIVVTSLVFAKDLKSIEAGAVAPDFKLKNYDGKEVALKAALKGNKFTVVMFIATKCPVSNAYSTRMVELCDAYSKKGVGFIGINANKAEDIAEVAEHSKKNGYPFPVLKDDKNVIADKYGAGVTPEVYVMNPQGKVVYHGRIDDSRKIENVKSHELADALDTLLAGKTLANTGKPAVGCSIKRIGED